jgi:opacity protein-like surface antigen
MSRFVLIALTAAGLFGLLLGGSQSSIAQRLEVSAGGGYAVPTNNVEAQTAAGTASLDIDLKPGPTAYAGIGFVRSLGDNFALGARVRAQAARLRTSVGACEDGRCANPEGLLQAAALEGRIIVTAPDWIQPYFVVGLGVVNASVEGRTVAAGGTTPRRRYEEISVTDAGGDVGFGASFPVVEGLFVDTEIRATGALPGGKENAVTALPFTLGASYRF